MGKHYHGLTLVQHGQLAQELREIENRLEVIRRTVCESYGVSSKQGRAMDKIGPRWGLFMRLKSTLDDAFYREQGIFSDARSPYYGQQIEERAE